MDYSFVTRAGIFSLIHNENEKVLGEVVRNLEVKKIESRIATIRELEKAEVYMTVDGILHVDADQRDPIMRVITTFGNSYYIDKHGIIIPHSESYTPRLVVISGNIELPDDCIGRGEIYSLPDNKLIKQAYKMAAFINNDDFWSSQIEQVFVNSKQEFELVPRVGRHIVKFGNQMRMENKFNDLKVFYLNALPEMGWEKYKEINLRYDGQIVCKKR
jgi:cell division protein FtsQ